MLLRRAETVVLEPSDREEVKHVKRALTVNGYKKWAFKIPKKREKVDDSPRLGQLLESSRSASPTFWCI